MSIKWVVPGNFTTFFHALFRWRRNLICCAITRLTCRARKAMMMAWPKCTVMGWPSVDESQTKIRTLVSIIVKCVWKARTWFLKFLLHDTTRARKILESSSAAACQPVFFWRFFRSVLTVIRIEKNDFLTRIKIAQLPFDLSIPGAVYIIETTSGSFTRT